ncbi:hypothetical protein AZE42_02632 [Rhizopogon vesiculosus]|uniref:Uncharacterized protein n=1 Tax=Rhizopogon vesiculosus TaxID=180088 RepID=A0A1J8PJP8_9AGAM|nr:hypothetical protein AZE42_02632 [Rhizopogon vesiculosus]
MDAMTLCSLLDDDSKRELDDLRKRINTLQERKRVLTSEAFQLHNALRTLQSRAAHITNKTAPVSRLPSDVLAIIFEESRRLLAPWSSPTNRPLSPEIQLSHVSSRWREVALSTPALWTTIRFPILHKEAAVVAYLQRCNQAPLSVHIGPKVADPDSLRFIAAQFVPRLNQIRELTLDTDEFAELCSLFYLFSEPPALILKRLKICCSDARGATGVPPRRDIFIAGAPLLSDIRLSAFPVGLPQTSATTLHFEPPPGPGNPLSRSAFLDILTPLSATLSTLHLRGYISGFHQEPGSAPVELPALKELVVHANSLNHGFNVFRNISTPAIESLSLVNVRRQGLSSIHKFIARTSPEHFQHLHTLRYINCDIDDDLDIYLPHATFALNELAVSVTHHTHLLRLLLNSDKQATLHGVPPLWPNLHTLSLHVPKSLDREREDSDSEEEDDPPPTMGLLLEVVQQRKAVGRPLDLIRIEGPHARSFHDEFTAVLLKAHEDLRSEFCSISPPYSADVQESEVDWAFAAQYIGHQYRLFMFKKHQQFAPLGAPATQSRGLPAYIYSSTPMQVP